jgi:hypothetical protein
VRAELVAEATRAGFDDPEDAFGIALEAVARLAN